MALSNEGLNLLPNIPEDQFITWVPLCPEMNVISRLNADDMSRIVGGIENDEDMCDFCNLTGLWHCYVMKDLKCDCAMAFCAIEVKEHERSILFHGGRIPDYNNTLLVYRGTAIMLKTLLTMNYSVETTTEYPEANAFYPLLDLSSIDMTRE